MSDAARPAISAAIGAVRVGTSRPLAGTPHASAIDKHAVGSRLWLGTLDMAALDALCDVPNLPPGWRKMLDKRRTERQVEDWTKRLEGR
ncbi:molybdenum cofactor sulfurase [Burkholderia aenigmatica]|uniref:Molybdenum cofactor sulfurase n=1 Tax=Burkholderia aenigmatica TaxID=2015348 RepID=A0A6P2N9C7_9BURK|nr:MULTISPECIES: hypothetical protein [Burkholderia]VWB87470.1 molybdenum cofactor sulfurase [Burkholderia aenigmatica]